MKKRVVSLLLCLVMLLSAFMSGCAEKTDEETMNQINEEASVNNITLSMWVVSEKAVSKETADAVTAAINQITEDKLKTRLVINFYTEAEYETKLAAAVAAFDNTAVRPSTDQPAGSNTNADGSFYEPTYPALLENQVDIIYITGEEMYHSYRAQDMLAVLDTDIVSGSANKPLQEYLSSVVMNSAKFNGKNYYAIPNNNLVGEYKYMMLNRGLMDEIFGGYANNVKSFFDATVYNYLETAYEFKRDEYVLIDGEYDELLGLLAHYWNIDSADLSLQEAFSLFGYAYKNGDVLGRGQIELGYENLFGNEAFMNSFLKLNKFDANGYFGDADAAGKPAAIKMVDCTLEELPEYTDEYYPVIVGRPTLDEEEFFENGLFGVCKKSVNVSRSMEIITYINTNAEVRNTLYYGVKGVHYDTKPMTVGNDTFTVAYHLNGEYRMDMAKTGNVFLVYPTVDLENDENSMDPNAWAIVKKQNFDALVSPTLGFSLADYTIDKKLVAYVEALNADLVAMIDEVKSGTDWYGTLAALVEEIGMLLDADSKAKVEDFTLLKAYLESEDFANLIVEDEVGVNDLKSLREMLKLAESDAAKEGKYSPFAAYTKWITDNVLYIKDKK